MAKTTDRQRLARGSAGGFALLRTRQQLQREIAERRVAEAIAADERERLRITLRCIGDGVIVTDAEGIVLSVNPVAEALTGWRETEAIGRELSEVFDAVEDTAAGAARQPACAPAAAGSVAAPAHATLLRDRQGTARPIEQNAAPVIDARGGRVGTVLVFRDVSRPREAARLLAQADRRKDEFLATLAHELRNPLAPLRNGVHLLRLIAKDLPAATRPLDIMDRQVFHMVRLIDDLLDMARAGGGKLLLQRQRVDLGELVREAVETGLPVLESAGHDLRVALPPGPVIVDADPTRLCQVIANLLDNAAKYTPAGGHVRISMEPRDDEVDITVEDDGRGIPAEMLPRIFEMFTQVDRSLEGRQGGLGIGLAIAQRLVQLHGGSLLAYSAGIGRGSRFVATLPRIERAAAGGSATAGPAPDPPDEAAERGPSREAGSPA